MSKYRIVGLAVLAAILAIVGIQWARRVKPADILAARLAEAIMQARASLPRFRERIEHRRPTDRAYFIRTEFLGKDGVREYLWLNRVGLTSRGFRARVAQNPSLSTVKQGDEVEVTSDRVVDWTIRHDDGTTEGDFTQGLEPNAH